MLLLRLVQNDGLTIGKLIRGIPHDLPAIIVYVLVAAFIYFIWRGSRSGS